MEIQNGTQRLIRNTIPRATSNVTEEHPMMLGERRVIGQTGAMAAVLLGIALQQETKWQ
jgi:hypothetical protein